MPRKPHDHYLHLRERHPALLNAVEALGNAVNAAGPLNQKTLHLIQLAGAAAIKSHGATHSHTIRALEAGATAEEVRHAVLALTSTIGYPSMAAAMSWVDDVLERGY